MADKIVQLIDKNGDNVFPVTVTSSNNAVTNAMLQDNSVTTTKIADSAVTNAKMAQASATGYALEIYAGTNVDINSFTKSGIYRFYTPFYSGPASYTYGTVFVCDYSSDFRCTQLFNGIDDNGNVGTFIRSSYHSGGARIWTPWKRVVDNIDMRSTDPGEGAPLSAGEFIAVYNA